ncbi:restriction endonuclease subunit S [Cellulophaga baltica]|uniref:restriction endonuclease subunit S n=1 Tax=Cellulophaga baltica TaxID=76594 RepID=UPI002147BC1B|nr:restriction endonuclease subunit S [Cellulophaga baltica]MCR1025771.1 restriction endonuclease subunit S [Cellulophaga baltica]
MRGGWKIVKFSDLFKNPKKAIISGPFGSNLKSAEYKDEGVPLVRLQNVDRWNFINKNIIYITHAKAKELSSHAYKSGDILISKLGAPLGKACIAPESSSEGIILADIVRVRLDPNSEDKKYIVYQINSEYIANQLKELTTGATRPRVTLKNVRELNFAIPPLEEQKQIVAILDKAFAAIDLAKANIEKNIANAKELFQSKLNDIFSQKGDGWEEKTFQDLSSRIGDGLHGTPKYDENGEYFFINGNNLNNGEIEIKGNTKRVNKSEYLKHKRDLNGNTVLVSINGTLGYVAFYNDEPVILGKSACYINFNKEVNKHYIKYLIKSPLFFENMANMSTGATIKNFSLKSMRNYKLRLPPFTIQESIVQELELLENSILKIESNYTKKRDDLEELKKSILQKAFAGELMGKEVVV